MKKLLIYILIFSSIIVAALVFKEWVREVEKQSMANSFITNAEMIMVIKDINKEGEDTIKFGGVRIYMPKEIVLGAKYKTEIPIVKTSVEAFLMTKGQSQIKVWINEYDSYFVVEGISGYFKFDQKALEAWRNKDK